MARLESHNGYFLWKYIPSLPAAIIFIAIFGIATTLHFWRMVKTRTWYCIAFTIGGVFQIIGYIGRAFSHDRTGELIPYIIQSLFILLAPALFAASIYMVLGRLIRSVHGEKYSIVRVNWLTKIFVAGDVFSFMVQAGGAGILVKGGSSANAGEKIIVGGLIIQVIMFGLFAITAALFEMRMHRHAAPLTVNASTSWKPTLHMLYIASLAIMVRSIFRVIEYAAGQDGYLLKHEWTLYIFDALLMSITMAVFYWRYPSEAGLKQGITIEDEELAAGLKSRGGNANSRQGEEPRPYPGYH